MLRRHARVATPSGRPPPPRRCPPGWARHPHCAEAQGGSVPGTYCLRAAAPRGFGVRRSARPISARWPAYELRAPRRRCASQPRQGGIDAGGVFELRAAAAGWLDCPGFLRRHGENSGFPRQWLYLVAQVQHSLRKFSWNVFHKFCS